jgi:hypothetical protein
VYVRLVGPLEGARGWWGWSLWRVLHVKGVGRSLCSDGRLRSQSYVRGRGLANGVLRGVATCVTKVRRPSVCLVCGSWQEAVLEAGRRRTSVMGYRSRRPTRLRRSSAKDEQQTSNRQLAASQSDQRRDKKRKKKRQEKAPPKETEQDYWRANGKSGCGCSPWCTGGTLDYANFTLPRRQLNRAPHKPLPLSLCPTQKASLTATRLFDTFAPFSYSPACRYRL